ncbi:unnamed protein product [Gordionus sp. m RMFG-2023]
MDTSKKDKNMLYTYSKGIFKSRNTILASNDNSQTIIDNITKNSKSISDFIIHHSPKNLIKRKKIWQPSSLNPKIISQFNKKYEDTHINSLQKIFFPPNLLYYNSIFYPMIRNATSKCLINIDDVVLQKNSGIQLDL